MKQALGVKKRARCAEILGVPVISAWTNGNFHHTHFEAECWVDPQTSFIVNYQTGEAWPCVRDGQFVSETELQIPVAAR